jgi:hypothetical protein
MICAVIGNDSIDGRFGRFIPSHPIPYHESLPRYVVFSCGRRRPLFLGARRPAG